MQYLTQGNPVANPIMLVILDGFGYAKSPTGNAITQAKMPFWHFLTTNYPSTLLKAAGPDVGLLPGYIGNSEVGHLTLGAGRIVKSALKKFHDAIDDQSFFDNKQINDRFTLLKKTGGSLHLMGLVSDGGVHSHERHLHALITLANNIGIRNVFVHVFTDGRDVPPSSAKTYLDKLDAHCKKINCGTIASISGRFYAMDRDKNWDRIQTTYQMLCTGQPLLQRSWQELLESSYKQKLTDEFIPPTMLKPEGTIKPGDGIFFFNFRPDRARQLAEAFINPQFQPFSNAINTGNKSLSFFASTVRYKDSFSLFKNDILFEKELINHTLLDEIAQQFMLEPKKVFIIAETEKYAHVTYFFRGMNEIQLENETRTLIPSIKAKDYTATPEMSAPIITNTLVHSLRSDPAYFYLVNYANPDMVGHSGNLDATIKACECVDQQLALLYHEIVERLKGTLIITGDHGNAEQKQDEKGSPLTAHTINPVPFVIASKKKSKKTGTLLPFQEEPKYGLSHIAPTILKIMGLSIPQEMNQETIV
jgi:2,3-bisphosphoglycerate-independent phosphoglycerate mutase